MRIFQTAVMVVGTIGIMGLSTQVCQHPILIAPWVVVAEITGAAAWALGWSIGGRNR